MTSHDIESLSVSAVKESVIKTQYLSPYINSDDKEPVWDGYICIYDDVKKTKASMQGRVHVQVKGREIKSAAPKETSFDVSVADLRTFLKDGGAIFFVVLISPVSKTIYYNALTPVRLITILSEINNQKTKRLLFHQLPDNSDMFRQIVVNFYKNCKKQQSFDRKTMISPDDLNKDKTITKLSTVITNFNGNSCRSSEMLIENDIYLYAQKSGVDISIPVLLDPVGMFIQEKIECNVSVCGKTYFDTVLFTQSRTNKTITIGDSIVIDITNDETSRKIKYTSNNYLNNRIRDLEFFIDALKHKEYTIDDNVMKLDEIGDCFEKIPKYEKYLEYLKKFKSVLEKMHVVKDLDLNLLNPEYEKRIAYLIEALYDNKYIENLNDNIPIRGYLKICNLDLLLVFSKVKNKRGTYKIYDYFDSNLFFCI